MIRKFAMLTALALSGFTLAHPLASGAARPPAGASTLLDAPALKRQLASKDFLLVNVHVPYEGEIAGTDAFVPFDKIGTGAALPKDKNREVVLYCRSGAMSALAARTLVKLGYTNVRELRGGMNAWEAAGFALKKR